MWKAVVLVVAVASGSVSAAQQSKAQYLIDARILAGNPQDTASLQVVASPTFRVDAGKAASMNLGDGADGVRLVVTPTDLGDGRVALHVVAESRVGGRVQAASFDVVAGMGISVPTVAPRDAAGGFFLGKDGRPLFIDLKAAAPKYRVY